MCLIIDLLKFYEFRQLFVRNLTNLKNLRWTYMKKVKFILGKYLLVALLFSHANAKLTMAHKLCVASKHFC